MRASLPPPPVAEKTRKSLSSVSSSGGGGGSSSDVHELDDFFDMLSAASSNRFDDQRSHAPKALLLQKRDSRSPPVSPLHEEEEEEGEEGALDEILSPTTPGGYSGFPLEDLPPPLAMSMPDLMDEDTEPHPITNSVPRLCSIPPAAQSHSKLPESHSYDYVTGTRGNLSEPLRRRRVVVHHEANFVGEETGCHSAGGVSPSVVSGGVGVHRASPLATTTYVYSPTAWRTSEEEEAEEERDGSGNNGEQSTSLTPQDRGERMAGREMEEQKEEEEEEEGEGGGGVVEMERDSPDGKVKVGDVDLPQRTFPDGAAVRRRTQATPFNPGQGSSSRKTISLDENRGGGGGVREGWVDTSAGKRVNPVGNRISAPISSLVGNNSPHRSQRVLSEGDRNQSPMEILEAQENKRSSHILIDAGLSFLSPHSPVVKGVNNSLARGHSFSGGSPKINARRRPPISEHHEM